MALMLVDFYKHQFEHFWAQGCRPRLLLSATPLKKWSKEERKTGVTLVDFCMRYGMPEPPFSHTIAADIRRAVHNSCYETYVRTYFRDWGTQTSWDKSWLDINNRLEASIQYYWELIRENSIRVVIFNDLPHLGSSVILYRLCRQMGVVTVICAPSILPNALFFFGALKTSASTMSFPIKRRLN